MIRSLHLSIKFLKNGKPNHEKTLKNLMGTLQNMSPVCFKAVNVMISKESLRYCHKWQGLRKWLNVIWHLEWDFRRER